MKLTEKEVVENFKGILDCFFEYHKINEQFLRDCSCKEAGIEGYNVTDAKKYQFQYVVNENPTDDKDYTDTYQVNVGLYAIRRKIPWSLPKKK